MTDPEETASRLKSAAQARAERRRRAALAAVGARAARIGPTIVRALERGAASARSPMGAASGAALGLIAVFVALGVADHAARAYAASARVDAPASRVDLTSDDPVVASIGPERVRLSQVAQAAQINGDVQPGETLTAEAAYARELVHDYIDQRLLARAAEKAGVSQDPGVSARIAAARARILAGAYLDKRVKAAVTPETVRAVYDRQRQLTDLGEEVRLQQIVVHSRTEADALVRQLNEGADFAALAKAHSIYAQLGPLGGPDDYYTYDQMPDELKDVASLLTVGTIAPPFQTSRGWHVMRIVDRRRSSNVSFDQAKKKIEEFLRLRAIEETVDHARAAADVRIYDPSSRARAGAAPDGALLDPASAAGDTGAPPVDKGSASDRQAPPPASEPDRSESGEAAPGEDEPVQSAPIQEKPAQDDPDKDDPAQGSPGKG